MEDIVAILREENAKDWVYKGEGAANLVLGYQGSSSSLLGKVLRIQKVPNGKPAHANGCLVLSKSEQLLWGEYEELVKSTSKEIAGQVYMGQIMSPLLDPRHVDGGVRIAVCKEFLESIKKNVQNLRPAWRIDATEIDIHCGSALLISDHSVFVNHNGTLKENMCFAVEIKPKCGFLPSSEFIAKRNAVKKQITRFKMHQLLKLHKGEISQVSTYDPLDLFSGSKDRICQAITALCTTPGNNFRVFLNGSLIFGGLGGGMDMTVVDSFEANERIESLIKVSGLTLTMFVELVAEALLKSAVLDKLLAAQKLDRFDIEGVIHLYYNIISEPCMVCKDVRDAELLHRYSFLHSFSLEESMEVVREYLISATAKDCSLIISFRPSDVGATIADYSCIFLRSCDKRFDYKANFIDLDLKPLNKMVQYYELDKMIVDYYTNCFMIEERTCISKSERAEENQH